MGRGNTCVHNDYEGLYFVDKDYLDAYYRKDDEAQINVRGIDINIALMEDYVFDEFVSEYYFNDFIQTFKDDMMEKFKSLTNTHQDFGVILENKLFSIVIEDNQWSYAVKLIQKEVDYDTYCIENLQKRHYQNYLEGIKECLFNQFEEIGGYSSAWTHTILKKESAA